MALTFHPLAVSHLETLTDEAVAVTFEVPPHLADEFQYRPGQHVTLRAEIDGEDVRRSYSICADASTGRLRVGIKRIPDGRFSTWATTDLRRGDRIDVMPPVGDFVLDPDPQRALHYAAIAAGSGITPILSHLATVLAVEPLSRFTLIFGNRESRTIMFLEELAALKDQYPDRFQVVHVLSRESQVIELFHGRIDGARLQRLFEHVVDAGSVDRWLLCGPAGLVRDVRAFLGASGVGEEAIADELFYDGDIPELPAPETSIGGIDVTFTLDGRTSTVAVDPDGAPILDHALQVRRELPFACRGGVCATCKARLVSGEVAMDQNWALVESEVERGLVLTCQAHPVSERVVLDYDV